MCNNLGVVESQGCVREKVNDDFTGVIRVQNTYYRLWKGVGVVGAVLNELRH